jgi:ATP-dependent Clp protease ATP-binding subunit ClpA
MGCIDKLLDPTQTSYEVQQLEADLRQRIVGQEEAIQQVVRVYQTYLAGMCSSGRPVANLLFLGPTGSGKTRLVEAVAESLLGNAQAVLKINCGEFQHSHEVAKLVGSPPGYLGHRETHPLLSQDILDQYVTEKVRVSFVLFDEIEKANDALWHLLLGILDKASLTLGTNRRVDFSRTMIFMTSNLGAAQMSSMLQPRIGFAKFENRSNATVEANGKLSDKTNRVAIEAARRKFAPEFMNRIDKVVVFRPLGSAQLHDILTLELNAVQQRVSSVNPDPFIFRVTESARQYLLQEGTDVAYGARHLKRAIDRLLVHPLSNLITTGQVGGGDLIRVDFNGMTKELSFFKDVSGPPAPIEAHPRIPAAEATAGCLRSEAQETSGWFRTRSTRR